MATGSKLTRFRNLFTRALLLRCPRCGQNRLFQNLLLMERSCAGCGLVYEREPGFFLGTIYFNYGLTALIAVVAYPVMVFGANVSRDLALVITLAFVLLFPLWFFRYARSLWLAFDQYFDPR